MGVLLIGKTLDEDATANTGQIPPGIEHGRYFSRLRRTEWAIRIPASASTAARPSAPTPPIVGTALW
jgi:hypothetical protein